MKRGKERNETEAVKDGYNGSNSDGCYYVLCFRLTFRLFTSNLAVIQYSGSSYFWFPTQQTNQRTLKTCTQTEVIKENDNQKPTEHILGLHFLVHH